MKYRNLFFAQGDEATEYLEMFDELGAKETVEYLIQIVDYESADEQDTKPWGSRDSVYRNAEGLCLIVNEGFGYIGLTEMVES